MFSPYRKSISSLLGILVVMFSMFFGSCKKNGSTGSGEIGSVPFLAGAENSYEWSATFDSSGINFYDERDTISIKVVSTSEVVGNYSGVVLLEGRSRNVYKGVLYTWYLSNTDSLTEIGYNGAGTLPVVMPKRNIFPSVYSELILPRAVKEYLLEKKDLLDTIIMRDDPRVVYRFPLSVGKQWVSFQNPFLETREVIGTEMVDVKAGSFLCSKIKTSIEFSNVQDTNLVWYDYVGTEGLVLRTITIKAIFTSEENPDGTGVYGISTERLELISRK
jgi:hypothetical protein